MKLRKRARGTPRIVNRLLRRVRDYAEVDYDGRITQEVANDALNRMEVDTFGLDEMDRKLLLTIIEKFEGGPVGVGTLSAAIHEEKDSIEEIIEPYLIQIGFLDRTPRGRMATPAAYEHFGQERVTERSQACLIPDEIPADAVLRQIVANQFSECHVEVHFRSSETNLAPFVRRA